MNMIKQLNKGINSLIESRKKWKNRYYNKNRKERELKNRINKAKEYIKNIMNSCNGANLADLQMLLDILKGEI